MPRNFTEGLTAGLQNLQALQSGGIDNASKKLQLGIMAQRLKALSGERGSGVPAGYVIDPLSGHMIADKSNAEIQRQEKAKISAENSMTDDLTGEPSTSSDQPPKALIPEKKLGIGPKSLVASSGGRDGNVPLITKQSISGGKKSLTQEIDPAYTSQLALDKSLAEERGKKEQEADLAYNQASTLIDNYIPDIKAALIESGGGGPIQGRIGRMAAKMGAPNTGNIVSMKNIKQEMSVKYGQILSGGNRVIEGLINQSNANIPDEVNTPEQAGTSLANMKLTAYAIRKGARINKIDLKSADQNQALKALSDGMASVTPEERQQIFQDMAAKFSNMPANPTVSLAGGIKQPEVNPINKMLGGKAPNFGPNFNSPEEAEAFAKKNGFKGGEEVMINGQRHRYQP